MPVKGNEKESIISEFSHLGNEGLASNQESQNSSLNNISQTQRTVPRYSNLNTKNTNWSIPKTLNFRKGNAIFIHNISQREKQKMAIQIMSGTKKIRIPPNTK